MGRHSCIFPRECVLRIDDTEYRQNGTKSGMNVEKKKRKINKKKKKQLDLSYSKACVNVALVDYKGLACRRIRGAAYP